MRSKQQTSEFSIDPNDIPVRDTLMIDIINGVTKAAVHVDRKREQNRKACRRKFNKDSEY